MSYLLRFVQKYRPVDRQEFMRLEARFIALESSGELPRGMRLQPYAGREAVNTLIWQCEFGSLVEAQEALAKIEAHPGHAELYALQVPLMLDTWTEIYEVLDFERDGV